MSTQDFNYKQRPTTREYREGWDRAFGPHREANTCASTELEPSAPVVGSGLPTHFTPFQVWAWMNDRHLREVVFALPPSKQFEHERGCSLCKGFLKAALDSMTVSEVCNALTNGKKVAGLVLKRMATPAKLPRYTKCDTSLCSSCTETPCPSRSVGA